MFTDFSCAITIIRYNILFIIMIFLSTILLLAQHYSPSHHIHTRLLKKMRKINFAHRKIVRGLGVLSYYIEFYVAYRLRIKYYRKIFDFSSLFGCWFFSFTFIITMIVVGVTLLFTLPFKHKKADAGRKECRWNIGNEIIPQQKRIIIIIFFLFIRQVNGKNELFMYFSHFLHQPYDDVDVRFY